MTVPATAHCSISDHCDGEKFFNPDAFPQRSDRKGGFWSWILSRGDRPQWPEWLDDNVEPLLADSVHQGSAVVTFINHSSFLIQLPEVNLITDPIFSRRASPVQWAGPKRIRAPGLRFEQLPHIDYVLISHNHYDHMDQHSIRLLLQAFDPIFIVPLENAGYLRNFGVAKKRIVELDWWQSYHSSRDPSLRLNAVPAKHWSKRTLWDTNQSLWSAFVIEQGTELRILFAADSGYGPHFKEITRRFGAMNLSILPIGAYLPGWFMGASHMNPAEAVQAHLDLKSALSLGAHFGTFRLSDEAHDQPVLDLKQALFKHNVNLKRFLAQKNGHTVCIGSCSFMPNAYYSP